MNQTDVQRRSDNELAVTRNFDAPARLVFQAWTTPELMMRWWAPGSMGMVLVTCEMDARTGGSYKFEFAMNGEKFPMAFVGKYLEVTPYSRIVWTNEEEPDGAVTTVTLTETNGRTHLELVDRYPSKAALEASQGAEQALPEQFEQLDNVLATLGEGVATD